MTANHQSIPAASPASLEQLDTPALIVDAKQYEHNIATCFAQFAKTKVSVRPHLKTAKSPIIAKHLLQAGARGFCVAKIAEAEIMAAHGIEDILITTEIVGAPKINRLIELVRAHPGICVVVDSLIGAEAINRAAGLHGLRLKVLLDVNVGQNRCGVAPESAAVFAQQLQTLPNLELIGVQGYEGHLQHLRDPQDRRQQAQAAMQRLAEAVIGIRDLGIAVPIVTTGGTGTSLYCAEHPIVTEVQPGSFIFMDSDYLANRHPEDATLYQSALSVLSTVISATSSDRVVIDAGNKSLSMDSGFAQPKDLPGWRYEPAGDEHGLLIRDANGQNSGDSSLRVGDRVLMLPSHIDTTVNLHDTYFVLRDGMLEDRWPILARGKVQ
jgi:D-serine deaminase-like pyridoxal phosphate-dependent protein